MSIVLSEFISNYCLSNSVMHKPVPDVRVFVDSSDPTKPSPTARIYPADNDKYFANDADIDVESRIVAAGVKLNIDTYKGFSLCRVTRILPSLVTNPYTKASFPVLDIYLNYEDVSWVNDIRKAPACE